jgi:hypothetical protein
MFVACLGWCVFLVFSVGLYLGSGEIGLSIDQLAFFFSVFPKQAPSYQAPQSSANPPQHSNRSPAPQL